MANPAGGNLRAALLQQLESLQAAGVRQLPKAKPRAVVAKGGSAIAAGGEPPADMEGNVAKRGSASPARSAAGLFAGADAAPGVVSTAETLEVLQQEVAGCTLCGELAATRTQTVFGVGNPKARLCFLGEAPGADEDRLGEPFVGRAGQLLNKILEACKLQREDVYILNILKCRPPGNRNPAPDEAHNCRRYLDRQLELIGPEFICCLGAVAAQNLLATTEAIGKMRGRVLELPVAGRTVNVVCTYHPAYLLRNPSAKKYAWDDMKLLMRAMGTPVD
jgi:uracil-DNA glycosylase family 4